MNIFLDEGQKQAVKYQGGPLLIIAGAGTGKTTVITERVKWLIEKQNLNPAEILALTFTEKAAREMEERVDVALPLGYSQLWISTFHSFCDRVLRNEAVHLGFNPDFKLLTEAETVLFLLNHFYQLKLEYFRPAGNPSKFLDGMLKHFSRLQDEDITPNQYFQFAQNQMKRADTQEEKMEAKKTLELAKAFTKYQELKAKEGVMDFADLIGNTLALFRNRPNLLKEYRQRFKYVLVDEFQDTNIAQYELIKLLAPPAKNTPLTVTGDDSQCLPPNIKITTDQGEKRIDRIKPGEKVLSAVGKGYTSFSLVKKVFRRKAKVRLLTFILEDGKKLTVTDNHKMFCYLPSVTHNNHYHYVYLMDQKNLGWRLGVTNDLVTRLPLKHHADTIIGIGCYKTNQEARFYESYCSAKFGLPTIPFNPPQRQTTQGVWLKPAEKLAATLHLELDPPHFIVNEIKRGVTDQVKIHLLMCAQNYRSKTHKDGFVRNPGVIHTVLVETSSRKALKKLKKAGIPLRPAKKEKRLIFSTPNLQQAWKMAEKLVAITGGILEKKSPIGTEKCQHKFARIVPASHILPGNYLPVLDGKKIIYKKVVERREKIKELKVYDLEVEKTHNFIANGIVVHNSIYKFRGAAVSNILTFIDDYPAAKMVVLTKNYRSTQTILDYAYRLIKKNDPDTLEARMGISKNLKSQRKIKGKDIEIFFAEQGIQEADWVAKEIKKLTQKGKYQFQDIAILVRANNHAEPFTRSLARLGIPYQFLGPGQLFHQPEIKDLIAYLKLLDNPTDDIALFRILSIKHFQFSARDLAFIRSFAKRYNLSLFEALEEINKEEGSKNFILPRIQTETKNKIKAIISMINRHLKLVPEQTGGQILYYFLQDSQILKNFLTPKTEDEHQQALNIAKFFDRIKNFENQNREAKVTDLVNWINLKMEMGESPLASETDWTENNAVNILTVHSAKGLEFPVVFMVNLVNQRFPTTRRSEQIPIPQPLIKEILPQGDPHEQEERRLFYVGITRAKDKLYFTGAKFYGDGKLAKKLSPFVIETLGEKKIIQAQQQLAITKQQLTFLDWEKPISEPKPIIANLPVTYLSYSQIDSFNTCPLQYRYRYLLRLPTPPSPAMVIGNTIHRTLKQFYQRQITKKRKLPLKVMLELAQINWIPEGFSSKEQAQESKKQVFRMLKKFYRQNFAPPDTKINNIIALEQPFSLKITPGLTIGGVIDRVDNIKSDEIEIIDYKTGSRVPSQKEVDQDDQLSIYALAVSNLKTLPFSKSPEKIVLSLYFLDEGVKVSTRRTAKQLEKTREKILKIAEEIEKTDFPPKPGKPFPCSFCEFKLLCETWR